MEYRRLGRSGLKVSALSYGSWVTFGDQIDTDRAAECMQIAYDHGVNFFDNAEAYAGGQSETMMGEIIQENGWDRTDLVLSTKIFWGGDGPNDQGLSRKHILEGTRAALDRLQTDYVDLVYCHRPDVETPIEETVRAMNYLVNQGYAHYWGTSEWSAQQIRHAYELARREHLVPPTMEQPQYNMFHRERVEREYSLLYDDIGLGTTVWSPLASGLLTGKYNDGIPDDSRLATEGYEWLQDHVLLEERIEKVQKLSDVADDLGCATAQLALAWCLQTPNVSTVITGASKPSQVEENMQALDVADHLDAETMGRIESILDNEPAARPNHRE
ncbi:alcohol dehydrogenase [Salinibacter sp. 10B]|uniref:potassium channel beta subunit family protein n=1 Tax=Salinibacter sp. 10B TaxID=1923971 RepID=UPI000CF45D7D|nr:aldo/keto reductase [Salinibacter sp. 10B]PQJ33556.1 alcohol dehydrogenase [Salinibacter sp. 10B]